MSINEQAEKIRTKLNEELNTKVSVAFFGQPGAGKSSLINAILGKEVAKVDVKQATMSASHYEHGGIILTDLPGYDTKDFPKEKYFTQFNILEFDLFLCILDGKLHEADSQFFKDLVNKGKICIFVRNKSETIWQKGKTQKQLQESIVDDISNQVCQKVEVIFTSCAQKEGLDKLQSIIASKLEDAKASRWNRTAKAYSKKNLEQKKIACEKVVTQYALLTAANGINPLPFADVAVDIALMAKMFSDIRDTFGLDNDVLFNLQHTGSQSIRKKAAEILINGSIEGIKIFLKKFVGRQAVKEFGKFIPIFGQVIAAGVGYALTSNAGKSYLDECYVIAEEILNNKLEQDAA